MSCPFAGGAAASAPHTIDGVQSAAAVHDPKLVSYSGYLQLDKILNAQTLESEKAGKPAHDELLFITIHQTYELWFKQIMFELDSIRGLFMAEFIQERNMLVCVSRLIRVVEILKILADQIHILETMTPLDFMEFRDFLAPASGFQSYQFRMFENRLGIRPEDRINYHQEPYWAALSEELRTKVRKTEEEPSLLALVEKWLERTPGLAEDGFNFWARFTVSVRSENARKRKIAEATEEPMMRALRIAECDKLEEAFETVLDPELHRACMQRGERRLSHKAFQGAIMIFLYREEPLFHLPFKMLTLLQDVDSLIMKWRLNHTSMVQRMIGTKVGTGGSSGYQYLRATMSDRYKVFVDLSNLPTFLVPRSMIPPLDEKMLGRVNYGSQ